jgi:hypothetical protein
MDSARCRSVRPAKRRQHFLVGRGADGRTRTSSLSLSRMDTDPLSLSLSDGHGPALSLSDGHGPALSLSDGHGPALSLSRMDTDPLSLSLGWTRTRSLSLSLSLSRMDTDPLSLSLSRTDTDPPALSLGRTRTRSLSLSRMDTDPLSLSLSDGQPSRRRLSCPAQRRGWPHSLTFTCTAFLTNNLLCWRGKVLSPSSGLESRPLSAPVCVAAVRRLCPSRPRITDSMTRMTSARSPGPPHGNLNAGSNPGLPV